MSTRSPNGTTPTEFVIIFGALLGALFFVDFDTFFFVFFMAKNA